MKLLSAIMSATFNRLSATNKQLACLYEIGKTIASSKNLAQMCDRVFKNIRNMCKNCNSGIMAVYNEFTEELDIHAAFGIDPGLTGVAKTDGIYQFIQFKKELLLNNISVEQPELKSGFITGKSLIASAFYFENKFLGFVMLASSEKNSFAINDLILLSSIASLASVSINNISFIAEEEARNRLNEIRQRREF